MSDADDADFDSELARLSARIDRRLSRLGGHTAVSVQPSARHSASPAAAEASHDQYVTLRPKPAAQLVNNPRHPGPWAEPESAAWLSPATEPQRLTVRRDGFRHFVKEQLYSDDSVDYAADRNGLPVHLSSDCSAESVGADDRLKHRGPIEPTLYFIHSPFNTKVSADGAGVA